MADTLKRYAVPAGTRASECRSASCRAVIYWIEYLGKDRKTGKPKTVRNPIDCSADGDYEPTASQPGQGVSHFQTCPDRDRF